MPLWGTRGYENGRFRGGGIEPLKRPAPVPADRCGSPAPVIFETEGGVRVSAGDRVPVFKEPIQPGDGNEPAANSTA